MSLKYLKYIFSILSFLMIILSSCEDDNTPFVEDFKLDLATVNITNTDKECYSLRLDNGVLLVPEKMPANFTPKDNQRVIVNYTMLQSEPEKDYIKIRINGIRNILTKNIVKINTSSLEADEYGNDPIEVISLWIGDQYLNFRFKIKIGGEEIRHSLDLLYDTSQNTDNDTIRLQLRHNAFGDTPRYEESYYAAFDLRTLNHFTENNITVLVETTDFWGQKKKFPIKVQAEKTLSFN